MGKMRDRFGRFLKGARSAGGRAVRAARLAAPGVRSAARAAYGGARSAYRAARHARSLISSEYVMGPKPKALWGLWLVDSIADPVIGGGQMSDTRPSAYQVWKVTKDLSKAYEAFKDRLALNEAGYSTKDGKFYSFDDPKVLRSVKSVTVPIVSTGIDWGMSWLVGYSPPRVGRYALIGHRRAKRR